MLTSSSSGMCTQSATATHADKSKRLAPPHTQQRNGKRWCRHTHHGDGRCGGNPTSLVCGDRAGALHFPSFGPTRSGRPPHTQSSTSASASWHYTTMAPLPLFIGGTPHPCAALAEPPVTRSRRARLQRDGIGANGIFKPLPVIVNPCAHATPPATAPPPPLAPRAVCVSCGCAGCNALLPLLLPLPLPPRPRVHGRYKWLAWAASALTSRVVKLPASTGRRRFATTVEHVGMLGGPLAAAVPLASGVRALPMERGAPGAAAPLQPPSLCCFMCPLQPRTTFPQRRHSFTPQPVTRNPRYTDA